MTRKFGPLGFQPDDRYRNLAETRVIDMLLLAGWPDAPGLPEAKEGANNVLRDWTQKGLGFRPGDKGERFFDPVEVYNYMKLSGSRSATVSFSNDFLEPGAPSSRNSPAGNRQRRVKGAALSLNFSGPSIFRRSLPNRSCDSACRCR